jgi:hypothetical protein
MVTKTKAFDAAKHFGDDEAVVDLIGDALTSGQVSYIAAAFPGFFASHSVRTSTANERANDGIGLSPKDHTHLAAEIFTSDAKKVRPLSNGTLDGIIVLAA